MTYMTRFSAVQKALYEGLKKTRRRPGTNSAQIDPETTEEKVYRNTKCDDSSSG